MYCLKDKMLTKEKKAENRKSKGLGVNDWRRADHDDRCIELEITRISSAFLDYSSMLEDTPRCVKIRV